MLTQYFVEAIFRLKAQNIALVMFLPTYLMRRSYNEDIDARLKNMWRTHRNRVDRGLGGTYRATGEHESSRKGKEFVIPNFHWSNLQLWEGGAGDSHEENIFLRWHESFEKYGSHLADMDDYDFFQTENFDRQVKFEAAKKNVVGSTRAIPLQDNDELFEFYDIQGESLYNNPPDPNNPVIDHGLDEEHVWNFGKSSFN